MPPLTRGPLPARVYWTRRLLVLGTALALVFGIGRLLISGSDGASGEDAAAQVAADTTPTTTPSDTTLTTAVTPSGTNHRTSTPDPTPTLAVPEGECAGTDIAVTPKVTNAVGGRPVRIVLQLRTLETPACTWRIDRDAVTVNITSGKDQIWSSRQCPRAIPVSDVVVRQAVTTNVALTWSARRSDDACSKFTDWAGLGWYHVTAAALGGEPSDVQFELKAPTATTITRTAQPTQSPSNGPSNRPSNQPSSRPSNTASGRPLTSPSGHPD
ncbi:hypothetical protein [Nocardioides sp. URHA0032]|uniref:hypothetical protein n=1 Tax=Nocardioides sp. URHA0032 TaxID=1380388 RepID=UPI00048F1CBB|nr:hypothetical protein [Nocardioides sp. URHA0032]